jgi:hypothetical protein
VCLALIYLRRRTAANDDADICWQTRHRITLAVLPGVDGGRQELTAKKESFMLKLCEKMPNFFVESDPILADILDYESNPVYYTSELLCKMQVWHCSAYFCSDISWNRPSQ